MLGECQIDSENLREKKNCDALVECGAILVRARPHCQDKAGDARWNRQVFLSHPEGYRQGGIAGRRAEGGNDRLLGIVQKPHGRTSCKEVQCDRIDHKLLDCEAEEHDAHVDSECAKKVQSETRRNSKGEAGNSKGGQAQGKADDHHGNLEHAFEECPQGCGALAGRDGECHANEQAENHHCEQTAAFIFGIEGIHSLGHWVFRNEVEKGGGNGLGLAAALDAFLGGSSIGLHKRLATFRRERLPRLDQIHKTEGNSNARG